MLAADIVSRILGPVYVVVALGLLIQPDIYRKMMQDFVEQPALCYIGGLLALIIGVLILTFHADWTASWHVVVTIIGWLACLKGVALLVFPKSILRLWQPYLKNEGLLRVSGVGALLLGLFLTVMGFGWA